MEYADQLRKMFLAYPDLNAKVFIDPNICNCPDDIFEGYNTEMQSVSSPEEADCIPIWLSYIDKVDQKIWNDYVVKYPQKCMNVVNFLETLNFNNQEISKKDLDNLILILSSSDWENINLGLNIAKVYKMTDKLVNILKIVIDSYVPDNMGSTLGYISPLPVKEQNMNVEVQNLSIIKYYQLLLHNKFL